MKPKLTSEQRQALGLAYLAGATTSELGARFNCSPSAVCRALHAIGIQGRVHGTTPGQQAAMVEAYRSGCSAKEAARRIGLCEGACRRALLLAGIDRRPVGGPRLYTLNERFFEAVVSEPQAYWLGFLTADGCVYIYPEGPGRRNGYAQLVVNLQARDGGHLRKLADALGSNAPVLDHMAYGRLRPGRPRKRCPQKRVCFSSRQLGADLIRLGVPPRKSLIVRPWSGPAHLMPHYWRGLIDGDGGWHCSRRGQWSAKLVGNIHVASAFADFVQARLGRVGRLVPIDSVFQVAYTDLCFLRRLAHLLYDDAAVWLDRKKVSVDRLLSTLRKLPRNGLR